MKPVPATLGIAAALWLAAPASAVIVVPPTDFSGSFLACSDSNGGMLRPGDDVTCHLTVLSSAFSPDVTATAPVPSHTSFDAALPGNTHVVYDPGPPKLLTFEQNDLGLMSGGIPKDVSWHLTVKKSSAPGDKINFSATIRASNATDTVVPLDTPLTVDPGPADLTPSTHDCVDDDGGTLRPGDHLSCSIDLRGASGDEDAIGVGVQTGVPQHTHWAPGGNESQHTSTVLTWLPSDIPGGVPAGGSGPSPLRYNLVVDDDTPGGSTIAPYASISWTNATSLDAGWLPLGAPEWITAPGPAILSGSTLSCTDVNGGTVQPGDDLACTLAVADQGGREDVDGLTGIVKVPAATFWVSGGSSITSTTINFDQSQLGSVAAGTVKEATFRLRVRQGTAPGTAIRPTATLKATSQPSATAITEDVTAVPLIVATPPAAPAAPAAPELSIPAAVEASAAPQPAATAAATRACTSRRALTLHIQPPRGQRWRSMRVTIGKKALKVRRHGATWSTRVSFRGLPPTVVRVKIVGRTRSGHKVIRVRSYRTCTTGF